MILLLRRSCKILLLVILNLLFLVPGILIVAVFFIGEKRQTQLRTIGMQLWAKTLCAVLRLRIRANALPKVSTGMFVAANHSSYTDVLVIGSLMPAVFVSKADVRGWPLFGWLAQMGGTVFVDRRSGRSTYLAIHALKTKLDSGSNAVIFPEGTTSNGNEVMQFRSSFFSIPADNNRPVLPLSIHYACIDGAPVAAAGPNEMAWHNQPLLPHFLNLISKKHIDVRVLFGEVIMPAATRQDRKALADIAEKSVREGFELLKESAAG